MDPRVAATLMCLCGQAMAASADDAPHGPSSAFTHAVPHAKADATPQVLTGGATREAPQTAGPSSQNATDTARAPTPAPTPAPAQTSPRERGLVLAGIALMVGIALRRLGGGAP
jgi:ABC-type uncharacterized transport system involved in gliding motility auxiliary subunit